jgi:death on curing protein
VSDLAPGTEYLSLEDLLDLVNVLEAGPVRDLGLLDSACHRPQASLFGQEAYPTLAGKAAALMHSLAGNYALVMAINGSLCWLSLCSCESTATCSI